MVPKKPWRILGEVIVSDYPVRILIETVDLHMTPSEIKELQEHILKCINSFDEEGNYNA